MARKEKDPQQIAKVDAKGCFFEVMSNSFAIGKVRFNFVQYDKDNGNKQTNRIDVYIDFKNFDFMYSGALHSAWNNGELYDQIRNSQYGTVLIHMGGKKTDSGIIAKELKIQRGTKYPFVLVAEQGPGKENSNGGFSIDRSMRDRISKIQVPMKYEQLCEVLMETERELAAFRAKELLKKDIDFEMAKVKDILVQICQRVGCDRDTVMGIINREPPRPSWQTDGNRNGQGGGYQQGGQPQYQDGPQYGGGQPMNPPEYQFM